MQEISFRPIILCGGSGTRLWPLSRVLYPKQFVDLGNGRTLFGDTFIRAQKLNNCGTPLVICNEAHRFFITAALQEMHTKAQIILEPEPRNTAPAIALAAFAAAEKDDPILLVLPSDHVIAEQNIFQEGVSKALTLAETGTIVTFGIVPTKPETGYGYIEASESFGQGFRVKRFVEKPKLELCQSMIKEGNFLWNSGIFCFKASTFLRELQKFAPQIYNQAAKAWASHTVDGAFLRPDKEAFLASPSDSIDYAIMEHTNLATLVPLNTKWSDMGSWEAFYQCGDHDAAGNVCEGDVLLENASNNYLKSCHRLIAALDIHDLCVVETADAILVAPRDKVQDVKQVVAKLSQEKRHERVHHRIVHRPWGSYETLAIDSRFQVKRIVVHPKSELSLQMHHHRAEHWVVVSGTAEVTNGEKVLLLTENESTYIPIGKKHRLKNPGVIPLVLIEIQSGSYLGEDDIVRFADVYGRSKSE
ncbi:MAG: mannose-1-phosphate guanylyltransferase/mannose-6-phosphate isomerase [Desulfovibrio sp.]|nr:mannose-1-phosphate guanylyltransferase/mannose-6-phosphate isomerase [Desulfovibrio sp.]